MSKRCNIMSKFRHYVTDNTFEWWYKEEIKLTENNGACNIKYCDFDTRCKHGKRENFVSIFSVKLAENSTYSQWNITLIYCIS